MQKPTRAVPTSHAHVSVSTASLVAASLVAAAVALTLALRAPAIAAPAAACEQFASVPATRDHGVEHEPAMPLSAVASAPADGESVVPEPVSEPVSEPEPAPVMVAAAPVRTSSSPARAKPRTFTRVMHRQARKVRACFADAVMPDDLLVRVMFDARGLVQAVRVAGSQPANSINQCIQDLVVAAAPPAEGKGMAIYNFSR